MNIADCPGPCSNDFSRLVINFGALTLVGDYRRFPRLCEPNVKNATTEVGITNYLSIAARSVPAESAHDRPKPNPVLPLRIPL